MEIFEGMDVKTADGTIGKVRQAMEVNGVKFYSLQTYANCPWGLVLTIGRRFVADGEIVAVKAEAPAFASAS